MPTPVKRPSAWRLRRKCSKISKGTWKSRAHRLGPVLPCGVSFSYDSEVFRRRGLVPSACFLQVLKQGQSTRGVILLFADQSLKTDSQLCCRVMCRPGPGLTQRFSHSPDSLPPLEQAAHAVTRSRKAKQELIKRNPEAHMLSRYCPVVSFS